MIDKTQSKKQIAGQRIYIQEKIMVLKIGTINEPILHLIFSFYQFWEFLPDRIDSRFTIELVWPVDLVQFLKLWIKQKFTTIIPQS